MRMETDIYKIASLFDKINLSSGKSFDILNDMGKQKSLQDYFKLSREKNCDTKSEIIHSKSDNTANVSVINIFRFGYLYILTDIIMIDISIIWLIIILALMFVSYCFLYHKLQYEIDEEKFPTHHNSFKPENNNELQFIITRNGSNGEFKVSSNEIEIGDNVHICSSYIPFDSLLTNGSISLYEQTNNNGEYIIDTKTIDNPFIKKGSYTFSGEGTILACSICMINTIFYLITTLFNS